MHPLKLFVDVHDVADQTFPAGVTRDQFGAVYEAYKEACLAEGVVNLSVHVGLGDGRAFCLNMAPDAEAVIRAHNRVGLPVGKITEVSSATPGDLFFAARA